MVGAPVVVHIP